MAKTFKVNTPTGQTVARKTYVVYGNTKTYAEPEWSSIGKRVEDSSAEMNWNVSSSKDILGNTFSEMTEPVVSQTFDPCKIDSEDVFQQKLLNLAIVQQNAQALANQDLLRVHTYLVDEEGNAFAERYPASSIAPSSYGGEGGGSMGLPIDITFGGTREVGTAKVEGGKVVFTPDPTILDPSEAV